MALEDAKKLLQMMEKDEALKQRLSKMTLEESLAYARESGLDITMAELEEAAKPQEMSPEEMNEVTGGRGGRAESFKKHKGAQCPVSPDGKHQWVLSGREIEVRKILFWEYHSRLDQWTCSACGKIITTDP